MRVDYRSLSAGKYLFIKFKWRVDSYSGFSETNLYRTTLIGTKQYLDISRLEEFSSINPFGGKQLLLNELTIIYRWHNIYKLINTLFIIICSYNIMLLILWLRLPPTIKCHNFSNKLRWNPKTLIFSLHFVFSSTTLRILCCWLTELSYLKDQLMDLLMDHLVLLEYHPQVLGQSNHPWLLQIYRIYLWRFHRCLFLTLIS